MENLMIVTILVVILFFAIKSTIKHFKGESSCCGGGTYKAKPRKLKNKILGKKVLNVKDMTCQHCVNRVTEAIHSIEGTSAKINLKAGTATISFDREINWDSVKDAVEKAGYSVEII